MSDSKSKSKSSNGLSALACLMGLATLGAVGGAWWHSTHAAQRRQDALVEILEQQGSSIEQLEGAVQYLRIEQKSSQKGVHGVIEQIVRWADVLCDSTASKVINSDAEQGMQEALRAMATLGPDAFVPIQNAILDAPDHFESIGACVERRRMWLLRAAAKADPQRTLGLAVRFVRGRDAELRVFPRERWLAADLLVELDPVVAAAELRGILQTESARGVNPNIVSGALPQMRSLSGFNNFLPRYLRTADPEQETTLLQILGKAEHDMVTKQECIKALAEMKSAAAVATIERLFNDPTEIANNAIFKNHCIHALVKIRGKDACPWLQDMFTNETNERVSAVLKDQIVKLGCS